MPKILDFMNKEHDELDELCLLFLEAVEKGEPVNQQAKALSDFKENLLLHMKLENEYLFPRLSASLGMEKDSAIAEQARNDHGGLIKLLGLMETAFQENNREGTLYHGKNLARALKTHHAREDEIQYPVSDRFISEEEWQGILKSVYGDNVQ